MKHEQLVAAVRSHETWVQSSGASGTQISMVDADLRNLDLRGYCLCEAMLPGANLCGAQMQRLDFFGANLASATLIGAQLELAPGAYHHDQAMALRAFGTPPF